MCVLYLSSLRSNNTDVREVIFLANLRIYYVQQNRRRDKLLAEGQVQDAATDEFADKTDLELPGFRYVVSNLLKKVSSFC